MGGVQLVGAVSGSILAAACDSAEAETAGLGIHSTDSLGVGGLVVGDDLRLEEFWGLPFGSRIPGF